MNHNPILNLNLPFISKMMNGRLSVYLFMQLYGDSDCLLHLYSLEHNFHRRTCIYQFQTRFFPLLTVSQISEFAYMGQYFKRLLLKQPGCVVIVIY